MKSRPWVILILAFLQIVVEPFANVFLSAYWSKVSPQDYFRLLILQREWLSLFYVVGLPIVMGVSIFLMRPWSYFIFLLGSVWMLYINLDTFVASNTLLGGQIGLPLASIVYLGNIAFVSYFLHPSVKAFFLDPRLRWWESKPRYLVDFAGSIQIQDRTLVCKLQDLSEGGAFLLPEVAVESEAIADLRFKDLEGRLIATKIRVAFLRPSKSGPAGCGVEFIEMSRATKRSVSIMIKSLKKSDCPIKNRPPESMKDFKRWFFRFLRTGKGILPRQSEQR